jgi:hypothetical protein
VLAVAVFPLEIALLAVAMAPASGLKVLDASTLAGLSNRSLISGRRRKTGTK